MVFLLVAGYIDSVMKFRGALLRDILCAGLEVHVVVPYDNNNHPVKRELESLGIIVHSLPLSRAGLNPVFDVFSFLSLARLMIKIKPDLVLAYTVKPVIYGMLAARVARVHKRCALITGLGYSLQGFREKSGKSFLGALVRRLYAFSLSGAQIVFFQNEDDKQVFESLNLLPAQGKSVVVNGSGVNTSEYPFVGPGDVRGPISFLLIARLLGSKGVRVYVEAARKIKERFPDTAFYLVGWIDSNPDAIRKDELAAWTNERIIEFCGKLEDVRPILAKASVFVLPSYYPEGVPRTILEALSMGKPVVTTDMPGCRDAVIDGVNGFVVSPRSVEALSNALLKFILSPGLVASMGQRSREIAEEKYDVHKVNSVMLREMGITL